MTPQNSTFHSRRTTKAEVLISCAETEIWRAKFENSVRRLERHGGGGGGMMAPKMFLTTVLKCLEGGS